jgi:hypothetical protein
MGLFWAHSPDFSPRRGDPGPFPRCQPGFAIESPPAEHEVSCWSFQSGGKAGERRGAGDADGSSYEQARAIYDYVIANMTYDKSGEGWGLGDAIYACNDKKGNCTDFHSLFIAIALARHSGALYDWLSARRADHGQNPRLSLLGGILLRRPVGSGGRIGSVEASATAPVLFGHLDADRVAFTMGRDLVLKPRQIGEPVNFLIYPYAQADGKPLPKEQIKSQFEYVAVTGR